ncbi:MAG: tRNA uridine-5-carboxymethylaminomethyl(34) synthesis GTPase MnmE [Candidatus Poribacteria bacterium]
MSRRWSLKQNNKSFSHSYFSDDTIAALATPAGGVIGIIRISGPAAHETLIKLTKKSLPKDQKKMILADLFNKNGKKIDRAMIVYFKGPSSFTGEDVTEIQFHGGSYIANSLMETLLDIGIRQALPGEFSFRAVRNGKMTLLQAQAVADLLSAPNDNAVSLALSKLSRKQQVILESIAEELKQLSIITEANIDFSDQSIDEFSLSSIKTKLDHLIRILETLYAGYERGRRIQEGISVALIGLPNAGKSSFFNSLLGEDRSIISEMPGTTRDVVSEFFTINTDKQTITIHLHDTAGLRVKTNKAERHGVERAITAASEADLLILVVDASKSSARYLASTLEQWDALGKPVNKTIGILSKCDLIKGSLSSVTAKVRVFFNINTWVATSALTGDGISDAIYKIADFCGRWLPNSNDELLLTRPEQENAVRVSLEHLYRARTIHEFDLFASDIRQARYALGPLIGDLLPDEILEAIFSQFCIGK